jgi:iron complex transport system substrate-binding protein
MLDLVKDESERIDSRFLEPACGSGNFLVQVLRRKLAVVELKSVERLAPVHSKQVLTYLRLMNLPVGLLINFGAATLKEGLRRIVNHLPPSASPRLRVNRVQP